MRDPQSRARPCSGVRRDIVVGRNHTIRVQTTNALILVVTILSQRRSLRGSLTQITRMIRADSLQRPQPIHVDHFRFRRAYPPRSTTTSTHT